MDRIPHTYDDGVVDPDARRILDDFWAWLRTQPQNAWLCFVRGMNWDSADLIAADMIRHPDCSRALASRLFFQSNPAFWLEEGIRPNENNAPVLHAVLDRVGKEKFKDDGLHYDRSEVVFEARRLIKYLMRSSGPRPFDVPLELLDNFDGANLPLGPFSPELEADLAEIDEQSELIGIFWRSDEDYFEFLENGGNRWYVDALRPPEKPKIGVGDDPLARLEALFGEQGAASDQRLEEARVEAHNKRSFFKVGWFGKALLYLIVGPIALLAALHFLGPVAAMIVLFGWLGSLYFLAV